MQQIERQRGEMRDHLTADGLEISEAGLSSK